VLASMVSMLRTFCFVVVIYSVKYWVLWIKENFIHTRMFVFFLCTKNVEFLHAVHIAALSSYLYYFHYVLHIAICVSSVYYMLGICGGILVFFALTRMCSLYRMLNDRPVWPIYSKGQSLHLSLYIPLCSYVLFPCCFCCTCFCKLFVRVVLYATFKFVFLNILVIFLTSCPKYVNVVHLSFACLFPCSFPFGGPLLFWFSLFNFCFM
jgi:hypothetical protein